MFTNCIMITFNSQPISTVYISNNFLLLAIIGHLIGDYLLQNDYIANNKKNSSLICSLHCFLWTLSIIVITGYYSITIAFLLFLTHFVQDRTTIINKWMALIGQHKFSQPPMAPWSVIVVDNVFHIATIYLIWFFLIAK